MGGCASQRKVESEVIYQREHKNSQLKGLQIILEPYSQQPTSLRNQTSQQKSEIQLNHSPKEQKDQKQSIQFNQEQFDQKVQETLNTAKHEQNIIQFFFNLAEDLIAQNKKDQAIRILQNMEQQAKEMKKKGQNPQVEDYVELISKLAILYAAKSYKYKYYLGLVNQIFDHSIQYFLEDRIALFNNLALAVQQSNRQQKYKQSIQLLEQCSRLQEKYLIVKDERVYFTKINLASSYFEIKQPKKAEQMFEQILTELNNQKQQNYQELANLAERNLKQYQKKFQKGENL